MCSEGGQESLGSGASQAARNQRETSRHGELCTLARFDHSTDVQVMLCKIVMLVSHGKRLLTTGDKKKTATGNHLEKHVHEMGL